MKQVLFRQDVVGKIIVDIVLRNDHSNPTFNYTEAIVVLENGKRFCVDSCGVDGPDELGGVESPGNSLNDGFGHLAQVIDQRVAAVASCDSVPSLVVVTDGRLLIFGSDMGPPFGSFGPVVQTLGVMIGVDELVDFWTRKPLSLD